ncbi:MAG: hypothetical protein RLZZ393_671 [Pseudomonadota bacterium]
MIKVHYFFDPLCGWCYGIAPLIKAAAALPDVEMHLHGGCLWPRPTVLPAAVRRQIRLADARVGQLSGQPYGQRYLDGLLPSDGMVLHSQPTTAAVLAAGALRPGADLEMLRAIQSAHYVDGAHVVEADTLRRLAQGIGLDADAFQAMLDPAAADSHMQQSQRLMQQLGVGGFPAVFIERDGHFAELAPQGYFGDPSGFVTAIQASGRKTLH